MFDDRYETISYDPHKCQKSHNVKLYKNYYSADKNSYCVFFWLADGGFSNSFFDFSIFEFGYEVGKLFRDMTINKICGWRKKPMKLLGAVVDSCHWKMTGNSCNDTTEKIDQDRYVAEWTSSFWLLLVMLWIVHSLSTFLLAKHQDYQRFCIYIYICCMNENRMLFFFAVNWKQFHFEGSRMRSMFAWHCYMSQLHFELIYHFYSKQISSISYSTFHFIKGISNMLAPLSLTPTHKLSSFLTF